MRSNEFNFLIRKGPTIEIIGYRMLEPEEGPWRPCNEKDSASKEAALGEIRNWWPDENDYLIGSERSGCCEAARLME